MHPVALRISPQDARSAVPLRRMHRRVRERCSLLFVLSAARSAKCPSSPPRESLFIVASALQPRRKLRITKLFSDKKPVVKDRFFTFLSQKLCTKPIIYDIITMYSYVISLLGVC